LQSEGKQKKVGTEAVETKSSDGNDSASPRWIAVYKRTERRDNEEGVTNGAEVRSNEAKTNNRFYFLKKKHRQKVGRKEKLRSEPKVRREGAFQEKGSLPSAAPPAPAHGE
jgi:hypothetical protein